jgi:hypothetical protein
MSLADDTGSRCHEVGRHRLDERQRLGRRRGGGHHHSVLAREVERDQARLLLEHEAVAGPAHPRQHEGGPDIGMAGERHLRLRREDADAGGVRRIGGRQHEGRLGEIELGGDGLHLLGSRGLGHRDDGQRIAAELAVGEDIDGLEGNFHGPCRPGEAKHLIARATDGGAMDPSLRSG